MKIFILTQICADYDEETVNSSSMLVRTTASVSRQKLEDLKKVWYEEELKKFLIQTIENETDEFENLSDLTIDELKDYISDDFYEKDNFDGFVYGSYYISDYSFDISESELD